MESSDTVKDIFGQDRKPAAGKQAKTIPVDTGCACLEPDKKAHIIDSLGQRIYNLSLALCRAGCKGLEGDKEAEMRRLREELQRVKRHVEKTPECGKK